MADQAKTSSQQPAPSASHNNGDCSSDPGAKTDAAAIRHSVSVSAAQGSSSSRAMANLRGFIS